MAQPARTKIVVSCPSGSNRFVVGGGSELRLYEWEVSPCCSGLALNSLLVVGRMSLIRKVPHLRLSLLQTNSTRAPTLGSTISAAHQSSDSSAPSPGHLIQLFLTLSL